jgi:hypothetical protein
MIIDHRDAHSEAPVCFAWSMPGTEQRAEGVREQIEVWLSGGAFLLLWTALALLLTS